MSWARGGVGVKQPGLVVRSLAALDHLLKSPWARYLIWSLYQFAPAGMTALPLLWVNTSLNGWITRKVICPLRWEVTLQENRPLVKSSNFHPSQIKKKKKIITLWSLVLWLTAVTKHPLPITWTNITINKHVTSGHLYYVKGNKSFTPLLKSTLFSNCKTKRHKWDAWTAFTHIII